MQRGLKGPGKGGKPFFWTVTDSPSHDLGVSNLPTMVSETPKKNLRNKLGKNLRGREKKVEPFSVLEVRKNGEKKISGGKLLEPVTFLTTDKDPGKLVVGNIRANYPFGLVT